VIDRCLTGTVTVKTPTSPYSHRFSVDAFFAAIRTDMMRTENPNVRCVAAHLPNPPVPLRSLIVSLDRNLIHYGHRQNILDVPSHPQAVRN